MINKSSGKLVKKLSGKLKLNNSAKEKSIDQVPISLEAAKPSGKIAPRRAKSTSVAKVPANVVPAKPKQTTTVSTVNKTLRSRKIN